MALDLFPDVRKMVKNLFVDVTKMVGTGDVTGVINYAPQPDQTEFSVMPANTMTQPLFTTQPEIMLIKHVAQALTMGGAKADFSYWEEEAKASIIAVAEFLEEHYEDDPDVSIFDACELLKKIARAQ